MTPVPPNTCPVLFVDYTGPAGSHTMKFDLVIGTLGTTVMAALRPLIQKMADLTWQTTTFHTARYKAAGSPLSFAIAFGAPIVSGLGTPYTAGNSPAAFIQFGARNSNGVRAKWYVFETIHQANNDMRIAGGALPNVDAVIAEISAQGAAGVLAAADGTNGLSVYNYANLNDNDYLVHKAR